MYQRRCGSGTQHGENNRNCLCVCTLVWNGKRILYANCEPIRVATYCFHFLSIYLDFLHFSFIVTRLWTHMHIKLNGFGFRPLCACAANPSLADFIRVNAFRLTESFTPKFIREIRLAKRPTPRKYMEHMSSRLVCQYHSQTLGARIAAAAARLCRHWRRRRRVYIVWLCGMNSAQHTMLCAYAKHECIATERRNTIL